MKTYPDKLIDMLNAGYIKYCHCVEVGFSLPLRLTDASHDVDLDGDKYYSSGQFLGLDDMVENLELRVGEMSLSFSSASTDIVGLILGGEYVNRPVRIVRAYMDSDTPEIIHSDEVWAGLVTNHQFDDDVDNPVISLTVASVWADFERVNSWRTSPASHKRRTEGDEIMKYGAQSQETIGWGRKY